MKKLLSLVIALTGVAAVSFSQITVIRPLCENRVNPVGLDNTTPRFSWQLSSPQRNIQQTAYEIVVEMISSGKKTTVYS
ncbi:MAG: hypothetical protein J7527_18145, partial [Chitinophagaceae bacterium]|nr:hypothetical protein [Chitinophagaceae bacterium]